MSQFVVEIFKPPRAANQERLWLAATEGTLCVMTEVDFALTFSSPKEANDAAARYHAANGGYSHVVLRR